MRRARRPLLWRCAPQLRASLRRPSVLDRVAAGRSRGCVLVPARTALLAGRRDRGPHGESVFHAARGVGRRADVRQPPRDRPRRVAAAAPSLAGAPAGQHPLGPRAVWRAGGRHARERGDRARLSVDRGRHQRRIASPHQRLVVARRLLRGGDRGAHRPGLVAGPSVRMEPLPNRRGSVARSRARRAEPRCGRRPRARQLHRLPRSDVGRASIRALAGRPPRSSSARCS